MAQPLVVQPIAIPRTGQMLKIKDLQEESNLKYNIDIIAVIAKIGQLKVATQTSRGSVPAREIYLCDDSWAMIKLIARDTFAENSVHFQSDQIIYIRNVKPMKLRGYTVLATMPDTLLNHEINTPEAISLRCWLSKNNLEFKHDGLKDLVFKKFVNLSSLNDKSSSAGSLENLNKDSLQSSQSSISVAASQTNDFDDNKNTININVVPELKRRHCEEGDSNMKIIKIDLTPDTIKANSVENNSAISDTATQRAYLDTSEKVFTKDSETVISIGSDDENIDKNKIKENLKRKVLEYEDSDIEVVDDSKDFIISETYNALMNFESPLKSWNTEKDKYLINYLSKLCTEKLTHDVYVKLFERNLNVFKGLSLDELKSRAEVLASAKNFIYLLQLCGGKMIKTEKEKCIFVARVEKLRRLIRKDIINDEFSN